MFRRLTIFISILLICQLSSAQTSPSRESVSINAQTYAGKKCIAEWGELHVADGSATFEYDEDYWDKDFDYSISINTTSASAPGTIEFPFGKLTIHEKGTYVSLRFSTLNYEERKKYNDIDKRIYSRTRSEAKEKGKENFVSIIEDLFPTYDPKLHGDFEIFATVYDKNSLFSVMMNNLHLLKKPTTQVPMPPPSR